MKIAVSSDNHIDVNRQDPEEVLNFQDNWLTQHQIDYYLFAGDLFNNFGKTADFMADLDARTPLTTVFYIAGNHDMLGAKSFDQIEHYSANQYLHNHHVDLPGSNWRIIGNNGWYDYSFSTYANDSQHVKRWKNVFWLDSSTPQDGTDKERMNQVLEQVREQLDSASRLNKHVLFMTHFAPRHELLGPKPIGVNTPRRERVYQMINAMMGSDRLGNLLESYPNVKAVLYGHLHRIHHALYRKGLVYLHQAVGVNNKRHNEWQQPTFEQQWLATMRVLDDDDLGRLLLL